MTDGVRDLRRLFNFSVIHILFVCLFFISILTMVGQVSASVTETTEANNTAKAVKKIDYKAKAVELFNQGLFAESISYWKNSAKQDQAVGDIEGEVISLYNLAVVQTAVGMSSKALSSLQQAWVRSVKVQNPELKARIKSTLGSALLYSGKIDKSESLLVQARKDAVAIKDIELEALVLNDLGNLFALQGKNDQALGSFEFSVLLGKQLNNPLLVAKAYVNAASVQLDLGRLDAARQSVANALVNNEKQPPSFNSTLTLVNLALTVNKLMQRELRDHKKLVQATVRALNNSLEFTATLGSSRLRSQVYGALAGIYELADQVQDAVVLNDKAIFEAQKQNSIDLLYKWHWRAGRLYKAAGKTDDSIRAYRFAVEALQPIRHELSKRNVGQGSSFAKTQGNVYLELADVLLQKTNRMNNKRLKKSLLLEARDTVELQKEAELQDYFQDSCVVNAKNNTKYVDETIAADTAVIYPILLPDRTELLVSYRSGMERYTVKQKEPDVTAQVRALRLHLESRRTRAYLTHAQTLYQWLIQPMEKDFAEYGITTLVLVADKSLRTIPISVLHDGKNFLIDKYALATTPGLKLTDPRPLQRQNLQILLSGLSESVQGFPALQHVRGELEEIQDLYVGKLLLNREFISSSVAKALRNTNYSVTHIASHSVFSGDVDQSYILTYDDRITVDQLGQFASINRNRDKPIELLTLSACQTAAGDDRAALGLAGVAIKAGARSALASLWAINDQASALLITEFYRELRNVSVTKAQALQRAQVKLMKNVRYRHPGYWSPFLLIGNWL